MSTVATAGRYLNKVVAPLVKRFSRWPSAAGRSGMAVLSYRGHRSGRDFTLVAAIQRTESGITIKVELPDQKRWWRNFHGQRRPITVEVAGEQRAGQALAVRDEQGNVHVHVDLD